MSIATLADPMQRTDPDLLREYQSARRGGQRGYFLTHVLRPATSAGQKFTVVVKLIPHKTPEHQIRSATFFFGRSWGNERFPGRTDAEGKFGMTTQAYGPFLALCEVEFTDGVRILLDHYCDFEMGFLIRP